MFARPALGLLMVLTLATGCLKEEPTSTPDSAPSSGETSTSSEGAGAAGGGATASTDGYHPDRDPLVNPEKTFEPKPADVGKIDTGQTLFRNMDGNPASLNPLFQSSTYEFYLAALVFEGLFTFDHNMEWMVNDSTVEKFEVSDDRRINRVTLREGLKWHDGKPLTSSDVVFSYQNIMDERVPCPSVRTGTDQLETVRAISPRVVEFVHKEPLPTSKWNVLFPIVPKHIYEVDKEANPDLKSGPHNNKYNRAPIGNGPYRFTRWDENDKIVLERWDGYPGPKPAFERIVLRITTDNNILLLRFSKGEVDEMRLSAKQFATQTLEGSDFAKRGVKVKAPQWAYSYISWNMWNSDGSNPYFVDKKVRHAMAHALDLDRVIRELAYNLEAPCTGVFHPDSKWASKNVKRLKFDLKKATTLLDEAGWKIDRDRGGWRHKTIDGRPTKFEFTLLIPQGAQISVDLAAIYQDDLRSIGVDMQTQPIEWATFQQKTRKHEYQASIAAWGTGTDPDTLRNIWHSESFDPKGDSGRNYGRFMNERVDELFELSRREFDEAKRIAQFQEIHEIVYDEQPYLFLMNRSILWGVSNRVRGVQSSPRGVFNFNPAEKGWWVPSGKAPAAQR
ncbi:MAG: ABC transporter substrate-binding protein [Planctomycetota bacterium]